MAVTLIDLMSWARNHPNSRVWEIAMHIRYNERQQTRKLRALRKAVSDDRRPSGLERDGNRITHVLVKSERLSIADYLRD